MIQDVGKEDEDVIEDVELESEDEEDTNEVEYVEVSSCYRCLSRDMS